MPPHHCQPGVWGQGEGKGQAVRCEPDTPYLTPRGDLSPPAHCCCCCHQCCCSAAILHPPPLHHLCVLILVVGALVGAPQLVTQAALLLLPLLLLILLVLVLTLLQLQLLLQVLGLLGNCGAAATSGQQRKVAEGELPVLRCTVFCCGLAQLQSAAHCCCRLPVHPHRNTRRCQHSRCACRPPRSRASSSASSESPSSSSSSDDSPSSESESSRPYTASSSRPSSLWERRQQQ